MFGRVTLPEKRETIAIGTIFAIGSLAIAEASNYRFGWLNQPGPGFFPTLVGAFLVAMALLMSIDAVLSRPVLAYKEDRMRLRPILFIPCAVGAFAALVESWGLAPAIFVSTQLAALADEQSTIAQSLVLAVAASILVVVVFIGLLGLPIDVWG